MDANFENLKREELRLMEFVRKSTWRCWIWVLAVAMVAIFMSMYQLLTSNIILLFSFKYFLFSEMILFIRVTKKS